MAGNNPPAQQQVPANPPVPANNVLAADLYKARERRTRIGYRTIIAQWIVFGIAIACVATIYGVAFTRTHWDKNLSEAQVANSSCPLSPPCPACAPDSPRMVPNATFTWATAPQAIYCPCNCNDNTRPKATFPPSYSLDGASTLACICPCNRSFPCECPLFPCKCPVCPAKTVCPQTHDVYRDSSNTLFAGLPACLCVIVGTFFIAMSHIRADLDANVRQEEVKLQLLLTNYIPMRDSPVSIRHAAALAAASTAATTATAVAAAAAAAAAAATALNGNANGENAAQGVKPKKNSNAGQQAPPGA